jgi:hypothetical protein
MIGCLFAVGLKLFLKFTMSQTKEVSWIMETNVYQLTLSPSEAKALNLGWGATCAIIIGAVQVAELMLKEMERDKDSVESLTRKLVTLMDARWEDKRRQQHEEKEKSNEA